MFSRVGVGVDGVVVVADVVVGERSYEGGGQVELSRSGICCLSQSVKCDTSA